MKKRGRRTLTVSVGVLGLAGVLFTLDKMPLSGGMLSSFLRESQLGQVILSVNVVNPAVPADSGSSGGSKGDSGGTSGSGGGGGAASGPVALATPVKPDIKSGSAKKGDVNGDGKVNLADFSILAYWYKRPLTDAAKAQVDLNNDGKITLADFSILAYYWNR